MFIDTLLRAFHKNPRIAYRIPSKAGYVKMTECAGCLPVATNIGQAIFLSRSPRNGTLYPNGTTLGRI